MTHPKLYADALALNPEQLLRSLDAMRQMERTMKQVAEAMAASAGRAMDMLRKLDTAMRDAGTRKQNDPIHVAGLEGRYLVRAGHMTEAQLTDLLRNLLTGEEPGTRYLSPENRLLVVTAALRGWATSYRGEAPDVLAWHRELAGTRLLVGRAA